MFLYIFSSVKMHLFEISRKLTSKGSIIHGNCIIFLFTLCYIGESYQSSCMDIKIMSLNTWGMPMNFGSQFKPERMTAIAKEVSKGNFDIYLLQELWMEADHNEIAASIPKNYSITGFRQLAGHIDGVSECGEGPGPMGCSGLAIISRFPFKDVHFDKFSDHGDGAKAFIDGEVFVRKGAGQVKVEPIPNVTIDFITTHTAADPDPIHGYDNSYYRKKQVYELIDVWLPKSTADMVVVGGDLNATPDNDNSSVYQIVRRKMKNSAEDVYYKNNRWLDTKFSTYGNQANTFTGGKYPPDTYDYIFWRSNNSKKIKAKTTSFKLPLFKTTISKRTLLHPLLEAQVHTAASNWRSFGKLDPVSISISDHEAITASISICS